MRRKSDLNITPPEMPAVEVQEELVHSYAVAKRLLPFLAKRGIPASPKNYRIFYDYLLFSNPGLNKTINELLENNAKFYSRLSGTIYDHFYSNEVLEFQAQALTKAAADFMTMSSDMERSLEDVASQSARYQKVLADTSKQMAGVNSPDELQPFLDELMAETEEALNTHGNFATKISEANQIINNLKAELKSQTALAKIDELTKLYNRRHFNFEAPQLIAQCESNGQSLSIITFDLDFFKKINDTWGHNFGDKVLVVCAEIIRKAARVTDLAVRMGGEEFLLLCTNLDINGAARVAERIRLAIAETDITIRGNSLPVTVSAGVAQYVKGEDVLTLVERADKAMYQAKNEGRNTVRVAPSPAPADPKPSPEPEPAPASVADGQV